MSSIKKRRLESLILTSHFDLYVGQCVPFCFCPRSIMLFVIHCANHPELIYRGPRRASDLDLLPLAFVGRAPDDDDIIATKQRP